MSPTRPGHPCNAPGCGAVTTERFCPKCAPGRLRADRADLDARRGTAGARGYGVHHRQWRLAILARDPLCVVCLAAGRVTPSTVADHVVALRDGGGWEASNGAGLCRDCHAVKTGEDVRRRNAVHR